MSIDWAHGLSQKFIKQRVICKNPTSQPLVMESSSAFAHVSLVFQELAKSVWHKMKGNLTLEETKIMKEWHVGW